MNAATTQDRALDLLAELIVEELWRHVLHDDELAHAVLVEVAK